MADREETYCEDYARVQAFRKKVLIRSLLLGAILLIMTAALLYTQVVLLISIGGILTIVAFCMAGLAYWTFYEARTEHATYHAEESSS